MSRKDYELIAAAIRDCKYRVDDAETWKEIARTLATFLRNTNPRFDRTRFIEACGVEKGR